jgi:hypothetical protein
MTTKLKWLKAYYDRAILPLAGSPVGKILYTGKNATGRRTQYVVNLDTNRTSITTIDAAPADALVSPGAIIVAENLIAPQTDKSLYIFGGAVLPVYAKTAQATFNQSIANGGSIDAINVLTGVTRNGAAATAGSFGNSTITDIAHDGLTLNTSTGIVTLDDNLTAGVYTLEYKVEDKNEPSVYVTGSISVTVLA